MAVQHMSPLHPSLRDIFALGEAVEERFIELCHLYLQTNHVELVPPSYLNADMLRWREMRVRHKSGDFRNTEDEKKSTRRIAEWTMEEKCKLTGHPYKKIQWSD